MSELPDGWASATLAEAVEADAPIIYGILQPGPDIADGVPYVRPTEIVGDAIDMAALRRTTSQIAGRYRRSSLAAGDVLLSIVGTIGKVAVVPRELDGGNITQSSCRIRPRRALTSNDIVAQFLRSPLARSQFEEARLGTAVPRLNLEDVRKFVMPMPPLPEQRRIVARIDSLAGKSRRARDHLDHIPRLVEKYKQAVLAAAFRGDLTREWRHDQQHPIPISPRESSEIRRKFADTDNFVPPYIVPGPWRWLRLPQLGDLDRGKSRHRPRNDDRLFGGSHPFIQTGEVRQAHRYLTSYSETYSDFGLAQSRLWPVGTVCITIAANIAETAILGIDACFPDSVVGFLADASRADASYVEFFLRTARGELEAFAPATAQKNINLDTLGSVRVPAAPIAEQREVVRRIEIAFTWIDRLASEATSARRLIDRLDQSVLAKAFRGELLPQDPADEPASVLLERIRAERSAAPKAKRGRRAGA
ncbi:restriction endonuclease subunit S [Mesorhizobium sp.]|uniref:restriction endonuclease subunit S n=1 Tax=Mesorhizobium sp. TaxID=1871066 RepID=UPI000FE470F8|nr:restriction endonuclease subunit S [Mesorhizobium sp.]RWP62578.1 MAG: restriction endonuclease subunit S [Mesorhizobium sp.]